MPLIRVTDFETTGVEPTHEVCEVGWTDYETDGGRIFSPQSHLCRVASVPPEARAVHHISAAETASSLPWCPEEYLARAEADKIAAFAAHNAPFEAQWLALGAIPLICTYKVALRVWPQAPGHNNGCLRYWLEDEGLIVVEVALAQPPHRAGPDSFVSAHVLKAAFAAGVVGKQMVQWTREPALLPTCPIGEHRGKPWADVPWGFLDWMVRKAHGMDPDLVWNAQRELTRRGNG
jgi:exodeoxyribonuclease X